MGLAGLKHWGVIAQQVAGRTAKQCRERWCNHLDPSIRKGSWTPEEDTLILGLQQQLGNKWSQIARHLEGRTENSIKIRWKTLTRIPAKRTAPKLGKTLSQQAERKQKKMRLHSQSSISGAAEGATPLPPASAFQPQSSDDFDFPPSTLQLMPTTSTTLELGDIAMDDDFLSTSEHMVTPPELDDVVMAVTATVPDNQQWHTHFSSEPTQSSDFVHWRGHF